MSELEQLIAEQARDDACDRVWSLSVEGMHLLDDARPRRLTVSDGRCGTLTAYKGLRCRCVRCRAANAAYQRGWKARRAA